MAAPMLDVRSVTKTFGGLTALKGASLQVAEGSITGLIGPNGAGKTTMFALIAGFEVPTAGSVHYRGADITRLDVHRRAALGIVRTFQIVQPFAGLSVQENIAVGAYLRHHQRQPARAAAAKVAGLVGLASMLDRPASELTVAGRKRLELARALATEPKLLLLDEVLAGLNPSEIRDMIPVIRAIQQAGVTILMVEHVMQAVMSLCQDIHVLAEGEIIARGTPSTVSRDARVIEAYLGRGRDVGPPAPRERGDVVLALDDVSAGYGMIRALHGVSLEVREGEIVALIGANGAGKTSTLRAISGLLPLASGRIVLAGDRLDGLDPAAVVSRGVVHVPEGRKIFAELTVAENLAVGAYLHHDGAENRRRTDEVLTRFPRLRERRGQAGGTLSGGEQQMLAIARALMARPRVLLLDEPSMGLAPLLVEAVFDIIRDINAHGTTILLVEQNAAMALGIASRGYVIEAGRIVVEGEASRLAADPDVRRAYLGLT
jgi:ABC-type branched-subunit amino acid transport system ATPase component